MSRWISTRPAYAPEVSCCYALYISGELKYIGQTTNLKNRMFAHRTSYAALWPQMRIKYRHVDGPSLRLTESALILKLKPAWNKVGILPPVPKHIPLITVSITYLPELLMTSPLFVHPLNRQDVLSLRGTLNGALRETRGGGRAASCDCGKCAKCRKRTAMAKYRAKTVS